MTSMATGDGYCNLHRGYEFDMDLLKCLAADEVFIRGTEPIDSCDLHDFEGGIDYQDDFEKIDESIIEKY